MQFAKDSFFIALRERLAGLNPTRTITLNGVTGPAIVVAENQPPSSSPRLPNALYVEWGAAKVIEGHSGNGALMGLECLISYYTMGTIASMVDRGRVLGQLDGELLRICQPTSVEKRDYTKAPSVDLGTKVFWEQPKFGEKRQSVGVEGAEPHPDGRVERQARLMIFFFSEVTWS